MMFLIKWRKTKEVIKEFIEKNKGKHKDARTLDARPMNIDPQKIIAINDNFDYPEILDDYKMTKLKKSVEINGWTNENFQGFYLVMLPNGDLIVGGMGNHRAVLSKELSIPSVKAMVAKVVYCD